jgi:hypothetical protein
MVVARIGMVVLKSAGSETRFFIFRASKFGRIVDIPFALMISHGLPDFARSISMTIFAECPAI